VDEPKSRIRERALALGFDLCRFTSAAPPATGPQFLQWLQEGRHGAMEYLARNSGKRIDPSLVLPEVKSMVVLATSYLGGPEPERKTHSGTVARYARFADYHDVLKGNLEDLSQFLGEVVGAETRSLWYTDTGPILERDLAQRAGLGFVGKHTNLISRELGNWFFISEILTTASFIPDEPERNRCGSCARCLTACPTQAITSPFNLDARRCISYLTIELKGSIPLDLRPAIGNRIYGCDDCLAVCPWNRFAREGRMMKTHTKAELQQPDLLALLELDELAFRKKFAGTPMLRTKRRGVLRNVCVALGNIGDRSALAPLLKATSDSEALIAEHASWALQRITGRKS
jgi:epoxyqueuosine reductase